jgi:hypothetical protein
VFRQSSRELIALDLTFYEVASVASRWPSTQLAALADRLVRLDVRDLVRPGYAVLPQDA